MSNSDQQAIVIEGATRIFGATVALDSLSLSIKKNTICGLLGSNGAGKTTLMALIAGHDRPNAGRVQVLGHNSFESELVAENTSFIRDNQRYPDDYVLRHVLVTARNFHPRWDATYAERLVTQFKLPRKTQVRKYSRGQLSALSIIVGLASRAPITIFDEPYLGLDIAARRKFYELLLEDFSNEPRTIIISTHLVEEMEAMFDQVVVLHKGQKVLDAAPEEIAENAFEVTGKTSVLADALNGLNVISQRSVGSLSSAVVHQALDATQLSKLNALGLSVSAAPIHDLVAAIGNSYEQEGPQS